MSFQTNPITELKYYYPVYEAGDADKMKETEVSWTTDDQDSNTKAIEVKHLAEKGFVTDRYANFSIKMKIKSSLLIFFFFFEDIFKYLEFFRECHEYCLAHNEIHCQLLNFRLEFKIYGDKEEFVLNFEMYGAVVSDLIESKNFRYMRK